jgi:BRCA1-associated protein
MSPPSVLQPDPTRNKSHKRFKKKGGAKKKTSTSQPQPIPRKSLIRKRPVTFGNPALGTYHGCLYTLDVIGKDFSHGSQRPIIEGAESVERVVAMVDVPPEQVPEGILNLARSHRPFLCHVRIVIAECNENLDILSAEEGVGQDETKEEIPPMENNGSDFGLPPESPSLNVSAVENAASILAADEELQIDSRTASTAAQKDGPKRKGPDIIDNKKDDRDEDNCSLPSRTYLVLLELCSVDAAEAFVDDLHGKPYTSLDETQTCSVYHVLALSGEDGVSLLSPFFAPSAKSRSPKEAKNSNTASEEILRAASSSSATNPNISTTAAPVIKAMPPTATGSSSAPAVSTHSEDYNCAVCLEHMIFTDREHPDEPKSRSSILTTVCNHTFHLQCLLQWQDSPCPVCRYDHSGLNEALSQCHICGNTEHNYVCLICGVVSCGGLSTRVRNAATTSATDVNGQMSQVSACSSKAVPAPRNNTGSNEAINALEPMEASRQLSQSHARKHYDETLHAYALDTETQHVWDFAGQGYVHRLLQNKEDGKLVEVHNPANTNSHERSQNPGLSDAQEGEVLHRKLEGFASQYYTLLKSQLEQQRSYYQGRLEELRRESLIKKKAQTSDLINALKQEKAQLSKRLVSLKARQQKVLEDVAFLKNMNESLEANKEPLKRKVEEAQRQRIDARDQIQQSLPPLEEKVTMLMLQLTSEASILGIEAGDDGVAAAPPSAGVECAPPQDQSPPKLRHSNSSLSDDRKPSAKP